MPRQYLFSLRIAHALRECLQEGYTREHLLKDILAGLTVGIIAIPLAMALSIAVGLPPQYGLYTAAIAGFLIPLTGGSRYSVSGPTAAFIVILVPVVSQFGLSGLLIATLLSGVILILMGWARLGRYIEYIPESVTLGFTGGIAIVIAMLQLEDFLGLKIEQSGHGILPMLPELAANIHQTHFPSLWVGLFTLAVMLLWPKIAATDNAFGQLRALSQDKRGVILYLDAVSMLDSGGLAALHKYLDHCRQHQTRVYLCDFQYQPLKVLAKSGFAPNNNSVSTFATLNEALQSIVPTHTETNETL